MNKPTGAEYQKLERAFGILRNNAAFEDIAKWVRSERDRMDAETRKQGTTNRHWFAGASFTASVFLEMCDQRGRGSDLG